MNKILCLMMAFFMAFSLAACASKDDGISICPSPELEEEIAEGHITDWKPVKIIDDFGDFVGYSEIAIEYETKCAYVGDDATINLPVVFTYINQTDRQGFDFRIDAEPSAGRLGFVVKDLLFKIDGESHEISSFDGFTLWRDMYPEDYDRIYEALNERKDVAFSVVLNYRYHYIKFAFTISGHGFEDVSNEYIK